MLSVSKLNTTNDDPKFHTQNYRTLIESHLHILREDPTIQPADIDIALRDSYIGDFDGLMKTLSIPEKYHWTLMRINGLHNSMDFTAVDGDILIIDTAVIDTLLERNIATTSQI